jgi:hypothetical protein
MLLAIAICVSVTSYIHNMKCYVFDFELAAATMYGAISLIGL